MRHFFKQQMLPMVVFLTGACVLVIEVVAVRALSPYYGNTIFTFSSVISVILAALSMGYWVGGILADRQSSLKWFFGIILASGLALLGFYFLGIFLLPALSLVLPLTTGPLISSFFLYLVPALLLGTLSPFAVKLQALQSPEQGVGSVAGKIFFWSTLGSITGSLLAAFVLIPHLGIDRIFIATGAILCALGFFPLVSLKVRGKYLELAVITAGVLLVFSLLMTEQISSTTIQNKDGVYAKLTIHDGVFQGRPVRFFQQDQSSSGAMFLDTDDPTDLVYEYTRYFSLYEIFKPDTRNALVIGGGVYSIPKALLAQLPEATVDVSEIEPSLFELSQKYFTLQENPRLQTYTEDGRRFLVESQKQYDFIFSDVYHSLFSVPAHFTTQEFFTLAKTRLSQDGIFIANLIGDLLPQQPSFILAEIKTFQTVFPNSYFFAVESPDQTDAQNIIFVGYNSDKKMNFQETAFLHHHNSLIRSLHEKQIHSEKFDLSGYPILTDNFSPVEYMTAQVLRRSL